MRAYLKLAVLMLVALLTGCTAEGPAPVKQTAAKPAGELAAKAPDSVGEAKPKAGALALTPENMKIAWVGTKPDGKHDGGFKQFSGTIEKGPSGLAGGKIVVDIDVDSIHSDQPMLTAHLKSPDFFDVRKNPKASFKTTNIEAAKGSDATHKITGDLTLHGVTKEVSFPAKVTETADGVQIESKFTIDRTHFDMTFGPGKVDNPVTISVSVNAKKS